MQQPIVKQLMLYCAGLAVSICMLALIGTFKVQAEEGVRNPISALAYQQVTGQLFKLQGQSLFVSSDKGQSWAELKLPDEAKKPTAFSVSADGNSYYLAEAGVGLFRREKTGDNWVAVDKALPSKNVTAFTTHATQPDTIYVFVSNNGIYRSQNAGKDWRKMDRGPEKNVQQMTHTNMSGSMDSGWLYVLTEGRLRLSMDCFCLWRNIGDAKAQVRALTYDPNQPEHVFAASNQGILSSINGGQDWQVLSSPNPLVTTMTVGAGGQIFVGTVDGKLYQSADGAKSWVPVGA
jgi:photosystem II stability/assembly factor-like uncharacterized protein